MNSNHSKLKINNSTTVDHGLNAPQLKDAFKIETLTILSDTIEVLKPVNIRF